MKKTVVYTFTLFCLLINIGANAQSPVIDSLRNVIHSKPSQTAVSNAYLELGVELYPYGTDSSLYYWEKSRTLCNDLRKSTRKNSEKDKLLSKTLSGSLENLGYQYGIQGDTTKGLAMLKRCRKLCEYLQDSSGIAYAYHNTSVVYSKNNKYLLARDYAQKALKVRQKINDKSGIASSNISLGRVYEVFGDAKKAFYHYSIAIKLFEEEKNYVGMAHVYNNMAVLFATQEELDKSFKYHKKAIRLRDSIGDIRGSGYSMANLASAYIDQEMYDASIELGKKALIQTESFQDNGLIGQLKVNLGKAFEKKGDLITAEQYYSEAYEQLQLTGDGQGLIYAGINLAQLYILKKQYAKAISFSKDALMRSERISLLEAKVKSAKVLMEAYQATGNWKGAMSATNKYLTAKNELLSEQNQRATIEQEMKYEYTQKSYNDSLQRAHNEMVNETKMRQVNSELARERNFNIALSLGVLIVLILLLFSWLAYQRKKRSEALIKEGKERIEKQNQEKELLLKEIHHRVKNNLQIVNGLLELQSIELDDPRFSSAMLEGQSRVKSMALIHEKLYQIDQFSSIAMESYIQDLSKELEAAYAIGKKARTEIICHNIHLDIDTAIPVGLILNELISNSWKYAFVSATKGHIRIELKSTSEGSFRLEYSDNGPGLETNFDWGKSKSLGLRLINRLTKQLFGDMMIDSQKSGFHFAVEFQNTELRKQTEE